MSSTHYSKFVSGFESSTGGPPDGQAVGRLYYDSDDNQLKRYDGSDWPGLSFYTTTSTSTTTTSTSTSTSTTTTSTSSSTSTTTSTSSTTSTSTTV